MQILYILRGCFAAYACAVLAIGAAEVIFGEAEIVVIGATAVFGLFAMIPFSVIALILWSLMAKVQTRVRAFQAVTICAAVFFGFAILGAFFDADFPAVITVGLLSPLMGGALGIAFWVGAFGLRREMTMGWRMPEES